MLSVIFVGFDVVWVVICCFGVIGYYSVVLGVTGFVAVIFLCCMLFIWVVFLLLLDVAVLVGVVLLFGCLCYLVFRVIICGLWFVCLCLLFGPLDYYLGV